MNIMLIGKNGQIGRELERSLALFGDVLALERNQMDLGNPGSIKNWISEYKPTIIVNAAAYTNVDKAEVESDLAIKINSEAPEIIAQEAKRINATVFHYSTDYVFDGTKIGGYSETDIPNPLNVYGKSKLLGEQAIQASGVSHVILRTSAVYGAYGKNFLLTMLKLSKEKEELKIVDDQITSPTWSRILAEATAYVIAICEKGSGDFNLSDISGLYHLSASGETSWHGFASTIIDMARKNELNLKNSVMRVKHVTPISTSDYPLPANRPRNSVLVNKKFASMFSLHIPDWRNLCDMCIADIFQKNMSG